MSLSKIPDRDAKVDIQSTFAPLVMLLNMIDEEYYKFLSSSIVLTIFLL